MAARRFFNTPELVHLVLDYLSIDRIDLLTLSLVSKTLRAQALQVWVKQLDLPFETVPRRLQFFKANEALLEHIRYLRLRHLHHDWDECASFDEVCPCDWNALNELLDMIARTSASDNNPPLLDISIYATDFVSLPPVLSQQIVALDIQCFDYLPKRYTPYKRIWDSDGNCSFVPLPSLTLEKLADIIHQARQGPGLRGFGLFASGFAPKVLPSDVQQIWDQVVQHASTLRSLRIDFGSWEFPSLFSSTKFPRLEELDLDVNGPVEVSLIEDLLDSANHLQSLALRLGRGQTLNLRQTFPRLRLAHLKDLRVDTDQAKAFAIRHPNLVCVEGTDLVPSETATIPAPYSLPPVSEFYPNLADVLIENAADLQRHLDAGRSFAKLIIVVPSAVQMKDCLALLHSNPAVAQRLTFLHLREGWPSELSFVCRLLPSLLSRHLPNLTELHLWTKYDWPNTFGDQLDLVDGIEQLMKALTSARSLKVMILSVRDRAVGHKDILHDREFPPALEYFCLDPPLEYEPEYFRFVPSHPEGHIVTTESGAKRGRLQRVPGVFRQRITKEGVWSRPPVLYRSNAVLDHWSDPPRLSLV
ncbi:hypothetical protein OC861_002334 [Tilletia horrida]|nr:hypothetical protein OC845_004562 [Tilletia horrida]KAK0568019.1 hypothetical protein OC861_002334 [Tilletia horrida]